MNQFQDWILGAFWIVVFSYLLFRIATIKNEDGRWLVAAFIAKILAGIAYGYLFQKLYPQNDTWIYFSESVNETQTLLHNPNTYFNSLFYGTHQDHIPDFFSSSDNSYWKYLGTYVLIKWLSVINLLSGSNYYVDVIFFNLFITLALFGLYLTAKKTLVFNNRWVFLIIFFFPGLLFWGSGIHKDGLVVMLCASIIVSGFKISKGNENSALKWWVLGIAGFVLLFFVRNVFAILLAPAIIAWLFSVKFRRLTFGIFSITYLICLVLFFSSALLPDTFNLPLKMAERQHTFIILPANSRLEIRELEPGLKSYLSVLPQAINHSFLRPYPNELKGGLYYLSFLVLLLFYAIIIYVLLFFRKELINILRNPFSIFLLSFAICSYLLIGYTVPITGAIVRYKAFYEVLLLIPFAAAIPFRKDHR
ncbi:MAG: hypothetical protein C5B52_11615 [Bacteroidetes bacterium]|nr:MAG: hypothetical protein C5B52_11615 [Bacteroidota bacterium]